MRRKINSSTLRMKDGGIHFCRICAGLLQVVTAGRLGPIGNKRLEQQSLIYDEVDWTAPVKTTLSPVATQTTKGAGPFWTFDVSTAGGLTMSNLRLENQPGAATNGK